MTPGDDVGLRLPGVAEPASAQCARFWNRRAQSLNTGDEMR